METMPIQWTPGNIIMLVAMVCLTGFLMGALARWIMPGPDPMSWPKTILLGVAGSLLILFLVRLLRRNRT